MKHVTALVIPLAGLLLALPAGAQTTKKKAAKTGVQEPKTQVAGNQVSAPAAEEAPTLQETKDYILARIRKVNDRVEIVDNVINTGGRNPDYIDISQLELSLLDTDIGPGRYSGFRYYIKCVPKAGFKFRSVNKGATDYVTILYLEAPEDDRRDIIRAMKYWAKLIGNTPRTLKFD